MAGPFPGANGPCVPEKQYGRTREETEALIFSGVPGSTFLPVQYPLCTIGARGLLRDSLSRQAEMFRRRGHGQRIRTVDWTPGDSSGGFARHQSAPAREVAEGQRRNAADENCRGA